jgi:putative membrane protein
VRLLLIWLINALSLLAVAYLLPSVRVESFVVAMVAALVLGLINTLIRPLLLLVTLPLNILTLGLFTLVVNALMFWFATSFFEGFGVAGFWSAFWGAIAYSLISSLASWLLVPRPREG